MRTRQKVRSLLLFSIIGLGLVPFGGCANVNGDDVMSREAASSTSKVLPLVSSIEAVSAPGPEQPAKPQSPVKLDLHERMALDAPSPAASAQSPKPLYTFRAQGMELVDALALFARTYRLNLISDADVGGTVSVEFHDLPFDQAMEALLDAQGYYWDRNNGLIRVHRMETRLFTLDYIRIVRSGTGRSQAQITSGKAGEAGAVSLVQEDKVLFWEELEKQLGAMLSPEGKLVVNRLSGAVQVTDVHQRVVRVERFLDSLRQAMHRQVEIEARIYEITLGDDAALGIDWTRINFDRPFGILTLPTTIVTPFGGAVAKAATAVVNYGQGDFTGVVNALREQGEVKIISQPRILTLNNQAAMIKVATDRSFFSTTTIPGTLGSPATVTEEVRTITVGLVLSISPQISQGGWVMLDISPVITRLVDTVTSKLGSTAPILDVKQSSALVRVKDGGFAVIGGLIQDETADTERKVPLLGDIPGLGYLFKGTYKTKVRRELVVFITPRIIKETP